MMHLSPGHGHCSISPPAITGEMGVPYLLLLINFILAAAARRPHI